ncbi:LysR family transcriptional regulator [Xanthobacter sp. KR7-65]|uniref:LysR family transcriptional regulator n=1 Tax=Xanthobacter sp. KR7-65 TaxID=3156612 RepID=UPI0032B57C44
MEFRQLIYFKGVAEAGSFARASERLRVAQPALSSQISKLEAQLKTRLFERHARGIWLTEAGRLFLDHATRIVDNVESARREMSELASDEPHGSVTVAMPTTLALVIAQPLLDHLAQSLPRVKLQIVEALSGEISQWYAADRFDLSVLYEGRGKVAEGAVPLCREDLYLLRPEGHEPLSATIQLSEIAPYRLYHTTPIHSCRLLLDETCARMGIRLKYVAEVDSIQVLQDLVVQKSGFSIFPSIAASAYRARGICYQRIVEPGMELNSYIAPARTRPLSGAQRAVMRLLPRLARRISAQDGRLAALAASQAA